ncbi:MAG: DUF87 domain-containing protein [Candidatus Aenigmatarchaeota archaeon]
MINIQEKLIADEIKKLTPILGKDKALRLSKAYLVGNEDVRQRIFELLDVIKAAVSADEDLRDTVLMEPPSQEAAAKGTIRLGDVLYGRKGLYPIMLEEKNLLTHIGIFGSSGYGKTNISYNLIEELAEKDIPVLIFDFSKRNYKDLLSTKIKDKIDIYTIGRGVAPFKFNPLKGPKGISQTQWMKEFSSIFDHSYWLLGGGRHVILKALDGVFKEKKNPTLFDLKDYLAEYAEGKLPTRERNWLATAERPLESLCFKDTGHIFDCVEGIKPSDFFKKGKVTILELDALDVNDKSFIIEIILQWIRDWLLVEGGKEEVIGCIVMEEAHHVLNREKSAKLGSETVVELIFREIRELGLGMIYIDQHPSLVSYPAIGNTSTHIYMNLGLDTKHTSDIQDASNMLGLDSREEGKYLRRLPVGHGFMLLRHSMNFPEPFLVKFDKAKLVKNSIVDDDIREHMKDRIAKEDSYSPPPVKEEEFINSLPIEDLGEQEWAMMKTIGNGSAAYTSQIYTNVKMSGATFKKKVENLTYNGLVDSADAKVKKNRLCYYFLTNIGEKVFTNKFGNSTQKKELNLTGIMQTFNEVGWKSEQEGNRIYLQNDGKELTIMVEDTDDRELIYQDLKQSNHFICASDRIKNMVIQQAARICKEDKKKVIIFVSTLDKFEENGSFEKVEFIG